MEANKGGMFKSLYLKDLREVRTEILIVAAVTIVLITWVYLRTEGSARAIIIAPTAFALGLAGFLPIITSFRLLGREWSNNTIYMLMSLPVSGTMMLGSKLAVLLTEYLAGTVIVAVTAGIAFFTSFPEVWQQVISNPDFMSLAEALLSLYGASIAGILLIFCCSFFSQVFGKLFSKSSGLITFIVFVLLIIIAPGIMPEPEGVLYYSHLDHSFTQELAFIWIASGISMVLSAILFAAAVLLWEHRIEL